MSIDKERENFEAEAAKIATLTDKGAAIGWRFWQARAAIPTETVGELGALALACLSNLKITAELKKAEQAKHDAESLIGQAHIICDSAGIPPGEIIARLVRLSGKGDAKKDQGFVPPPFAAPVSQRNAPRTVLAEFVALDDIKAWLKEKDYADHTWWWKEKKAEYERRSSVVFGSARAALAAVASKSVPRMGGNTKPCGGCGESDPDKRCIGCLHDFATPQTAPGQAPQPACRCEKCNPQLVGQQMFLCATCGNKRCPHATDHALGCTGSNLPGQPGSAYGPVSQAKSAAGKEES